MYYVLENLKNKAQFSICVPLKSNIFIQINNIMFNFEILFHTFDLLIFLNCIMFKINVRYTSL